MGAATGHRPGWTTTPPVLLAAVAAKSCAPGGTHKLPEVPNTDRGPVAGLSSVLGETEEQSIGHGAADACAYAVSAPEWIDKMFQVKAQLDLQTLPDLKFQTFCKHFGLATRDCLKALSAFQRCSDKKGRLLSERLSRMLRWPTNQNRVVARIILCFDSDADGEMNFREFLMVAAMHMPECSDVDILRFWWWVMLFSDESSAERSTSAARQAPIVKHSEAVELASHSTNDSEVRVPIETIARFLRDVLLGCTGDLPAMYLTGPWMIIYTTSVSEGSISICAGLKIAKAVGNSINATNPAPSKVSNPFIETPLGHHGAMLRFCVCIHLPVQVFGKVMNLMLSKGKGLTMKSKVSFGRFLHLCKECQPQFKLALVFFFDSLAMLLRTAPHKTPISVSDSLQLKAFFYNKADEFKEIEKAGNLMERARQKSGLAESGETDKAAPTPMSEEGRPADGNRRDADPAIDDAGETSGYSSVSDYESDASDGAGQEKLAGAHTADGLFSTEASPAPRFESFWEKQARRKPAMRPVTREESCRRAASYLAPEYEGQLVLRRSALSAHLDKLDATPIASI